MILKAFNECLPLLKGKIDVLFNAIVNTEVDPSSLKYQIEKYMIHVDHLDTVQWAYSMKISLEVQSEHSATVASQIVV